MQFRDLKRQYEVLKPEIDAGISKVISSSAFISGAQVGELESALAEYVGVKHCITCGNGTDAITIALMAHGIGDTGAGSCSDAVFVPDFTFFSSGECPAALGATPIFVDVKRETYNIDPQALERSIEQVIAEGVLTPRAVVAVDLFGLPAEFEALRAICKKYGLLLLEDGAQGFGGAITDAAGNEKRACSFGDIATTSFFPAKPLGCYGDGGAVFTNDDHIANLCRSIAVHGKDMENPGDPNAKYNNIRLGMNSRLDTIQAAILLPKLRAFQSRELAEVNRVAESYTRRLACAEGLTLPVAAEGFYSSWAQYTVQLPGDADRGKIQSEMRKAGIPTMVYYRKPMHRQTAFAETRSADAECPVTKDLCQRVLCLPIHPYLREEEIELIAEELKKLIGRTGDL